MSDFLTCALALTDSTLLRTLALTAALVWAAVALIRLDRRLEERRRVRDLAEYRAAVLGRKDQP